MPTTLNEIWKDIIGYEGLYQVSNLGRVKSLSRTVKIGMDRSRVTPQIILAEIIQSRGYVVVTLSKDDKQKRFRVNRIVATAFIPNPLNLPEVNHVDTVKKNNKEKNLEWCTRAQNVQHAYDNGVNYGRKRHIW